MRGVRCLSGGQDRPTLAESCSVHKMLSELSLRSAAARQLWGHVQLAGGNAGQLESPATDNSTSLATEASPQGWEWGDHTLTFGGGSLCDRVKSEQT